MFRRIHQTAIGDILFEHINKTGIIKLNKPKTLNALTYPVIKQILTKLKVEY